MSAAVEQARWFRSVADHLEAFPELTPVNVRDDSNLHMLSYLSTGSAAAALVAWADSVGASLVEAAVIDGKSFVYAPGPLRDGCSVLVWTVVDEAGEFAGMIGAEPRSRTVVPVERLREFAARVGGAA